MEIKWDQSDFRKEDIVLDKITHDEIKDNLNQTIKQYLPNLQINEIVFENLDIEEAIKVIISFTITEGVFNTKDTVEITF